MQALAERVMAERQQAQSMEIDLRCGGVNLTGWLQQVQPDGLLRWRPSLLSVSGMQLWLEHLVYCAAPARAGCLCGKRESGAFRRWRPPRRRRTLTSWWMAICWGCRSRCCCCRKAVARLKACYDAEKDVILMDEETQQKARSKFLQTYEGNMVVSGRAPISGINACGVRWSRRITKKSLPRRSVICYRYIVTIGPHKFK